MPNVIGESFSPFVTDQINKRQKFLSSNLNYSNEFHLYNSKTSFLRLTSGVTVNENVCKRIGFNDAQIPTSCVDDNLAKNFVLFSSFFLDPNKNVTDIDKQDKQKQYIDTFRPTSGVGYGYGLNFNPPSQGFLSSPDFGFVPPPGIESATIKTLNKGTLKEATIKITAHNLLQFRVIEALFLRLRYSLLLEWGHSIYLNNTTGDFKLNQTDSTYDLYRTFLKNPGSQRNMLEKIENLRKKSHGNYDAFLGVIKNFNWNLKSNGTYDITVIAISTGDVIDSLKINTSFDLKKKTEDINAFFPPQFLKSTLHTYCREIQLQTQWNYSQYASANYELAPLYNKSDVRNTLNSTLATNLGITETFSNNSTPNGNPEAFKVDFPNFGESSFYTGPANAGSAPQYSQYYIKLGALLRFIEAFLLEYDSDKNSNEPIFRIDHNITTNKFLTLPFQASTDPTVCMIPINEDALEKNNQLTHESREYNLTVNFARPYLDGKDKIDQFSVLSLGRTGFNNGNVSDIATVTPQVDFKPYTLNQFYLSSFTIKNIATNAPETITLANPIEIPYWTYTEAKDGGPYPNDSTHKKNEDGFTWFTFDPNLKYYLAQVILPQLKSAKPTDWQNYINEVLIAYTDGNGNLVNPGYYFQVDVNYFTYTTISTYTPKSLITSGVFPVGMAHIQYHTGKDFRPAGANYTAYTMNILVNLGYIIDILDKKIDKNGNVDTLKFLKSLMDGIKGALGGINDFEVTFDDVDNTFRIIDQTYVANSGKDDITELQVNLLKPNSGTFVKEVSLKTELTSRIANAIAAGAQKNGNTMVSNGTTFAKFNEGHIDRIIEKKQNKNNTGLGNNAYAARFNIILNYLKKLFTTQYVNGVNGVPITSEEAAAANGAAKDVYEYELGQLTMGKDNKATIKGTMFIPLNLQVTVDGISGIKQYQLFKTNQELLPADYHDRLAFIVKGLTHKIDDKGWETTIETLAVKRFNKDTKEDNTLGTTVEIQTPNPTIYTPPADSGNTGAIVTIGGDTRYQPLKDIIARYEGRYDSINNGTFTEAFGKSYENWTILEVQQKTKARAQTGVGSSAAGKYQFMADYIVKRAENCGLTASIDYYTAENQEKMVENLLDSTPSINKYIKGLNEGTFDQLSSAVQQVGQYWTSKPVTKSIYNVAKNENKQGNYGDVTTGVGNTGHRWGDSSNPKNVKISVGEVVKALIETRKNFVDVTKTGKGGLPVDYPNYAK